MYEAYFCFGYNGYWDGYWTNPRIAIAQLQINHDGEAINAFMRGWNTATHESNLI